MRISEETVANAARRAEARLTSLASGMATKARLCVVVDDSASPTGRSAAWVGAI
jgi:hypothetical protein